MMDLVTLLRATFILMSAVGASGQTIDPCSLSPQGGYEFFLENIMENVPVGSELGVLPIKGADSEITLIPTDHDWLEFNETTRSIVLKTALSVDKDAPEIPKWTINCLPNTENARMIPILITILILDYNNHAPTFNGIYHNTTVSEDTNVGAVIYKDATATDNDKPFDRNSQIIYSIVPGNYSDYFRLEASTTSVILLNKKLDYEMVKQMTIKLKAVDRAPATQPQMSSTATITVNIEDADDLNPEFTYRTYYGSIPEDAAAGTYVSLQQRIMAEDKDSMNVSVKYRLLDPYGMFDINETTARIRYIGPMYEGMRTVTVVVLASQVDNPSREGFAILTITITEANINAPKFTQDIYYVTKVENEPVGSVIVQTSATDPDFMSIWGTRLHYSLLNNQMDLNITENGNIILLRALDYETERRKTVYVTATDGEHTSTATVELTIVDVNDNTPQLTINPLVASVDRDQGIIIARATATDADINNILSFSLGSYEDLFQINSEGEVSISAPEEDLLDTKYPLLIKVSDNEKPPRESSGLLVVNFPPLGEERTTVGVRTAAVTMEEDNLITIILGAVAGALAVVIIIMIVYIVWRNKRTKEELDRARAPLGHAAKGLTYRQAEAPDDLPKMDLNFGETDDSEFGGSTTIQENPLRSTAVNEAYLQSSGSEMDRDVGEIEIQTSVVPYDDDFGYPSGRMPYMSNPVRGAEDSTSTGSSQSDSTGGSRRVLVNDVKQNGSNMTSWDSNDKIHPQGSEKLLDSVTVTTPKKPKKEKPEITVYF